MPSDPDKATHPVATGSQGPGDAELARKGTVTSLPWAPLEPQRGLSLTEKVADWLRCQENWGQKAVARAALTAETTAGTHWWKTKAETYCKEQHEHPATISAIVLLLDSYLSSPTPSG